MTKEETIKTIELADDCYDKHKYKKAMELYLKVSKKNLDDKHILMLCECFVEYDMFEEAIPYLLPVAKKGNDVAEFYLSGCYGEINFFESYYWLKRAAEHGNKDAKETLKLLK